MLLDKMDDETRREYEKSLQDPKEVQPLQEFLNFINKHIINLNILGKHDTNGRKEKVFNKGNNKKEYTHRNQNQSIATYV